MLIGKLGALWLWGLMMLDKQTIVRHLVRNVVSGPANFLNKEETSRHSKSHKRIISHACTVSEDLRIVFFSDNHLFGYQSEKQKIKFVPCSTYIPLSVVERPGLESGLVTTLDEYNFVFNSGPRDWIIYDFDELVRLIQQHDLLVLED